MQVQAVEPGEDRIERIEGEGHVIDRIVRVLRRFGNEVQMDGRPGPIIKPGPRKAEVGPPSAGEADRVGIEGDRTLEKSVVRMFTW